MNKLSNARPYTTAPKSQADRQASTGVCGVDGYCLAETRESPLSYIILPNLFRSRSASAPSDARAFKRRKLGLPCSSRYASRLSASVVGEEGTIDGKSRDDERIDRSTDPICCVRRVEIRDGIPRETIIGETSG